VLSLFLTDLSFSERNDKMDGPKPQPRTKLIEARKQRKLSQQQVAERIGTTYVNVSRWERGITRPGPYFQHQLSRLFGRTEEELDLAWSGDAVSTPARPSPAGAIPAATTSPGESESAPVSSPAPAAPAGEAIYDSSIPLPPPVHLVGRGDALAHLRARLRAGESVAMTALHGLPGVGKTTLAITLAHDAEMRAHFRDGILWAALGPHPDISSILSHWSLLLGVATSDSSGENDSEALAVQLHRAIGTRRMLLVIDDAWELEDALAFKVGGPECAHLVTTRFPGIAGAFAPDATSIIRELGEEESVALLHTLAPLVMKREPQKARELALAAGGLPLALTLLGNYLRLLSGGPERRVDAALARLSNAEERLHISEPRSPTERHTSLRRDTPLSLEAVIDVTCQQLKPPEKATLYALSVFPPKPGHFSEEAACFVANCEVDMLDVLIDTGLLEYTDASHYRLHQTIADYACAALQNDPVPYERLITYAMNLVEKHRKEYEILEPEYDTILAALESAHTSGKTKELMRCVYAFIPYLRSRGLYEQAEKQLQRAYDGATSLCDDDGKSQALLYFGEIAQKRGNFERANTYLQDGLLLARQIENPERISAMLADLGWITWKRGEYTRAESYLNEGLTLARQIDNSELICDILETLGYVAASRGEYHKSKEYMEKSLKLARDIGDREKECSLLINLGVTLGEQGEYVQAVISFKEALEIARRLGHREWIGFLLINLGGAADELGNYKQAEKYFEEGLEIARQIQQVELMGALLVNLGSVLQKQNNYVDAEKHFQRSLSLADQLGRPDLVSAILYEYGNLYLNLHQPDKAEISFHQIFATIPESGESSNLIALAQFGMARVALARGSIQEARILGETSAKSLKEIGHHKAKEVQDWLNLTMI
jgi:tetratricopeptide (TPR) repeat protein/transcriptional regulator with XRE-family HTH domain